MRKLKPATDYGVLYEAVRQAILPLKDSIEILYDDLYHVKPEDRASHPETPLSEVLEWCEAVIYDYEVNSTINKIVDDLDRSLDS